MTTTRFARLAAFAAILGMFASPGIRRADAAQGSTLDQPRVTRVFYLHGMELREALMLLRAEVAPRAVGTLESRKAIVVADVAEKVERVERLLRAQGAIARATTPHAPLATETSSPDTATLATHRLVCSDAISAANLLRTLYEIRDIESAGGNGVIVVHAAEPVLTAGEALLRELGLLAAAPANGRAG